MIYDDISRIMATVLFVILIYFIDGDYRYNTDHFFYFFFYLSIAFFCFLCNYRFFLASGLFVYMRIKLHVRK